MPDWVEAEVGAEKPRKNTWVANLQNLEYAPGHLKIGYNLSDMKTLFGARKVPKRLDEGGRETLAKYVAAIGFIGIIETSDYQTIYEVRGKSVQVPGKIIQLPAGNLEDYECSGKMQTPIEGLYQRANKEVGFDSKDMHETDVSLIGVVRDRMESWNPALVFIMNTPKTSEQVREKYQVAKNLTAEEESERLIPKQLDEKVLHDFVLNDASNFVGNGIGATLLHGRLRFGRKWHDDLVSQLNELGFKIVEENPYKAPG